MRRLIVLVFLTLLLTAAPAPAQDPIHYVNDAHGFEVTLPDGFSATYADTQMSIFAPANGTQEVLVVGGTSFDPLERLTERHMGYDEQDGWITQPVAATPSWVTYSGRRNGMQLAVRMIEICPRWQYARLEVVYPDRDAVAIKPLIERMEASFRATGTATCE